MTIPTTRIELRHDHTDNKGRAYYKPVDEHERERGPSLFVNPTLVSGYFRGIEPERTRLTAILEHERPGVAGPIDPRPDMKTTRIELRYHHTNDSGYAYYKPVDDDARGARRASLIVNRTLVSEHFRGIEPERTSLTLVLEND